MSSSALSEAPVLRPVDRLELLFDELSELTGQRNAINGRIVEIVAEFDRHGLLGIAGCRSVEAMVAWKTACTESNAKTITTIAGRLEEFPLCAAGMREGRLSLDQVGVIAKVAADGSDAHYAQLASVATVSQLRTAVKCEPRPEPKPEPWWAEPKRSLTKSSDEHFSTWRIRLPHDEAAVFDAALTSRQDALIAEWKRDRETVEEGRGGSDAAPVSESAPPLPNNCDAFMSLVRAGWDAEVAARPHGQHTTVVVHLDVADKAARWHLGPVLTDTERQHLTCDATFETWFERDGVPIGAGRTTRQISRRLRRALEFRHPTCGVPGCGATRGLHAHHIRHWEDGGATELDNLVLLCPYHHRLHHAGGITVAGPAPDITVTDSAGRELSAESLARPPNKPPPAVAPCPGPTGERADWWWYQPFQPHPPPTNN